MMDEVTENILMAFIREFAAHGLELGPNICASERRERIRVAILKEGREGDVFHDYHITYAQAFQRCFNSPIERRSRKRDQRGRPSAEAIRAWEESE